MRTSDWLKIKARLQQEFAVGGFREGKGSRQRLALALNGGAFAFLAKPIDAEAFLSSVRRALGG
jgi:DNA-binding NtrC family response regulator